MMLFYIFVVGGCKFKCRGGTCLPESSLVCNEIDDCGDRSDEKDCLQRSMTPRPNIPVDGKHTSFFYQTL